MFHSDFLNKYIRKYSAPINYLIGKQALELLFAIGLVITMIQMSTIITSNQPPCYSTDGVTKTYWHEYRLHQTCTRTNACIKIKAVKPQLLDVFNIAKQTKY